jgi:uncharacterized protein YhaN
MITLRSIAVSNFRKFTQPVIVSPLKPGVNVIAGANEDGKSTIVAAVKAALYKKYSSTTADELQPYNSSLLPTVCLEFDLDGCAYRLMKAFGRKGTAELRGPNNVVFSGSQAEEKLKELLRLGDDKRGNTSIWNVLLVEQGKALEAPALAEIGKQTLEAALESEIGKMVSGDSGQALLARVKQLYSNWFTDTGKYKTASEYKQSEKELEELRLQYEQKKEEYESYKQTLVDLDEARAALRRHEQGGTIERAKRQLTAAQAAAQSASQKSSELEKLIAVEDAERANYQRVAQKWESRQQAAEKVATMTSSLAQLAARSADLQSEIDAAAQELHRCQQAEEEAERRWQQAEAAYAGAEKMSRVAHCLETWRSLSDRLSAAKTARAAAVKAKEEGAVIKVDRAAVQRLRELEKQFLQCQAQLQAAATRIEFKPTGGNSASRKGAAVDESSPVLVTEPTTFELSGWGALRVVPGGDGIEQMRKTFESTKDELAESLKKLQVDDVSQAEELERRKASIFQRFEEHARDVGKFAPRGIDALQEELNAIQGKLEDLGFNTGDEQAHASSPTMTEAAAKQADASKKNSECRDAFNKARQAAQTADKVFGLKTDQLKSLSADHAASDRTLKELSAQLTLQRESEDDHTLEQQVLELRARMQMASSQRAVLAAELKELDAVNLQDKIRVAASQLETAEKDVERWRDQHNVLAGSLKSFGKAGIAEEFHRLSGRKEQLESQVARLQKRASAVRLLYETVTQAQANAKSHLMRPLLQNLKPYVEAVFDGATLSLDKNNFAVTQLSRQDVCEDYNSLSVGTREQLSVLTRLSFANVLSENNCPALVILDDVLVYSDAMRLQKMQAALKSASERFQVIILTCRPDDWQCFDGPLLELKKANELLQPTILSPQPAPDLHQATY